MNKPFLHTIVLRYVSKQPQIPLFGGYNIEFDSTFCKKESEIIQHVFVNCMHILPLWSKLGMHILRNTEKVYNILFGEICFCKGN